MTRRRWMIVQLVFAGALVALALPASSLALRANLIVLTSTGPSPAAATVPAGLYPVWVNQDTVSHTVTFANGCSVEVAPGDEKGCGNNLGSVVGDYAYTVDGTTQASVKVVPWGRTVTLTGKRHGFRRGSKVLLHGTLFVPETSPPTPFGPQMPVTILERPVGHRFWYRLKVVMATTTKKRTVPPYSVWRVWVRPHGPTTYKAVANSQPKAGQYWVRAVSRSFGLYPRHGGRR